MASNASSLRFVVEVSADEAQKTLKAMTVAFNEAGAQAKIAMSQLGATTKAAGAEVITLGDRIKQVAREQRQEARAASFYVQEIAQIIPISNAAKIAIGGMTEALVGGVGIGAAIALVTTAVRLLTAAWREEKEAAEKAAEAEAKAAAERRRRMLGTGTGAMDVVADLRAQVDARKREAEGISDIARAQEWATLASIKAAAQLPENERIRGSLNKRYQEGIALLQELERLDARIAANEARRKAIEESRKPISITSADIGPGGQFRYRMPQGEAVPFNFLPLEEPLRVSQKDIAKGQREYNEELQKSASLAQEWGTAMGDVLGKVMTGQASIGEALASVMQMVVQQATQAAIAEITTSAMVSGAKAAEGKAIFGPVVAISAMGAMISAVLALLGRLPGRALGGQVGFGMPYVVGERGPELFVPGTSGRIVPNNRMGSTGGITLNIGGVIDSGSLERTITANDGAFARAQRKMQRRRRA